MSIKMGWQFLEFKLGRFINGIVNGFSFAEFDFFRKLQAYIVHDLGGGVVVHCSKLLLKQDVPSDPDTVYFDVWQIECDGLPSQTRRGSGFKITTSKVAGKFGTFPPFDGHRPMVACSNPVNSLESEIGRVSPKFLVSKLKQIRHEHPKASELGVTTGASTGAKSLGSGFGYETYLNKHEVGRLRCFQLFAGEASCPLSPRLHV
ncbi:hypothetical protein Tco_0488327 [Tanacetum coccineum]